MTEETLSRPEPRDFSCRCRIGGRRIPRFWPFAILYTLTWVVLCTVFQSNFRADVIEQYMLGDLWIISSGKNPILSAWILNFFRGITCEAPFAPYLAAETFVFIMLFCIWQIARSCLGNERLAFLAVLASANFRYLNVGNLVFANNSLMVLGWTLAIFFLYRALSQNRLLDWVAVGLSLAAGLNGKYTVLFLAMTMLLFMLVHPRARRYWRTPGPYLTLVAAVAAFLPHVAWLFLNDFHTFDYTLAHSTEGTWTGRIFDPWLFPLRLLLVLLPSALTLLPLTGWAWQWRFRENLGRKGVDRFRLDFLGTMILVPTAMHMLAWGVFGFRQPTCYSMCVGMYLPVFFLALVRLRVDETSLRRTALFGYFIMAFTMIVWAAWIAVGVRIDPRPPVTEFPGPKLAETVEKIWTDHYGDTPCPFVVEPIHFFLAGNVHVYGRMHIPFHDAYITPNSTNEEVNRRGGIVLIDLRREHHEGFVKYRKWVAAAYPRARWLPDLEIPYEKIPLSRVSFEPLRVAVGLIPPENAPDPERVP